jgi:uncharacterized membrane protein YdjX (TVP38/TMEM64 family)
MEKAKKIKIFIGLFYLTAISIFLYFLFSKFSIKEITSYDFIKNNRDFFFELKSANLFMLASLFIIFCIIWTLAGGFGSPVVLFAGFIFGNWLGTALLIIGLSIGSTLLYIFANYFLKEMIRDKFLNRFKKLEENFRKSEFLYLLIYRFVGGIPFQIQNVLPCIFDVKIFNFFWSTLLGMIPSLFIVISIGSGLEEIIDQNLNAPSVIDLITSPSIYIPLIAFFGLLIITIFFRKVFYKN